MPSIVRNFGTIDGFSLVLARVKLPPRPGGTPATAGSVFALSLTQGAVVRQIGSYADSAYGQAAGEAIITAIAALGGSIALGGGPATPISSGGTAEVHRVFQGGDAHTGHPCSPRSRRRPEARRRDTVTVTDQTGGHNQQYEMFPVIDAVLTSAGAGASVQALH